MGDLGGSKVLTRCRRERGRLVCWTSADSNVASDPPTHQRLHLPLLPSFPKAPEPTSWCLPVLGAQVPPHQVCKQSKLYRTAKIPTIPTSTNLTVLSATPRHTAWQSSSADPPPCRGGQLLASCTSIERSPVNALEGMGFGAPASALGSRDASDSSAAAVCFSQSCQARSKRSGPCHL